MSSIIRQNNWKSNFPYKLTCSSCNTRLESSNFPPLNFPKTLDNYRVIASKAHPNFSEEKTLTQNSHLDYLSFTAKLPKSSLIDLLNFLVSKIDNKSLSQPCINEENSKYVYSPGGRAKYYRNKLSLLDSVTLYYTIPNENYEYDGFIDLKGSYFTKLSLPIQLDLLRELTRWKTQLTRLDIAINDLSHKLIPLSQMLSAYSQGNHFYFRKYYLYKDTHYFGGKGSRKLVRIYCHQDKFPRYEAQFRDKYAQAVFSALNNSIDIREFQEKLTAIAVGVIDFRDRSKLKNPKKAHKGNTKRLFFWRKFIDALKVEPIRFTN